MQNLNEWIVLGIVIGLIVVVFFLRPKQTQNEDQDSAANRSSRPRRDQ